MSYASYHQQQNLVLPNISLVFRNVTFPSAVAWNTLKGNDYCFHGKYMRFYDSLSKATNLLLVNETYLHYNGDGLANTQSSYDYRNEWWFSTSIIWTFYWPFIIHGFSLYSMGSESFQSSSFSLFYWIYGMFGMVDKQLNLAARYGHLPSVQACLKRGVDVNCTDNKYFILRLLHLIFLLLYFGPFYFLFAWLLVPVLGKFWGIIYLFNPSVDNADTPLMRAVKMSYYIFPSVANADTPLMWAVKMRHLPVVTYLLEQNANVKVINVSIVWYYR